MSNERFEKLLGLINRYGLRLGCAFMAPIFLLGGWSKLMNPGAAATMVANAGLPLPGVLVIVAIVLELGGAAALITGYQRAIAALALFCYLIPVTLALHPFWHFGQPDQPAQFVQFSKNLAILGGLLLVGTTSRGWNARLPLLLVRILVTWIFFMNAFGVIRQDKAMHEIMASGVPPALASLFIKAGQLTQAVGGLLVLLPRRLAIMTGAIVLACFLVPATIIAHSFWNSPPDIFTSQLLNFFKNLAAFGALVAMAGFYSSGVLKSPEEFDPDSKKSFAKVAS
jgi:putative oxidoreductase